MPGFWTFAKVGGLEEANFVCDLRKIPAILNLIMGDKKPPKKSSGNSDAHKAKKGPEKRVEPLKPPDKGKKK